MGENIVIICYKYPPEYSGYGRQLKSVISQINKFEKKNKMILLTANISSKIEETENLDIVPLNKERKLNSTLYFYLFCIRTFFWLIKNNKNYRLIHCVKAGPEAVLANVVSKFFNKKLIIKVAQDELSEKEINSSKGFKHVTRRIRHFFLLSSGNFIAISEEIEKNLKLKSSEKSFVLKIPNGVDNKKYKPVNKETQMNIREKLNLPVNEVIVLFAGAINRRKGIVDLLEALIQMNNINKCSVVICGPMLENLDFEKKIQSINKENKNLCIKYIGTVNNVDEYMKASDIFVLPSYSEGLPNVLLEAAATGLPSIVTDIGGNRDIVSNNLNGFLVPINDPLLIKENLVKLIDNQSLRDSMGSEAREAIDEKFSINRVARLYSELYESLLNET